MTVTHTPGPFRVWIDRHDGSVNISGADGEYLCLVGRAVKGAEDRQRILADADWIAAALNAAKDPA